MRHRLERGEGQRHRLGHALDGQVAVDRHRLVAVEFHGGRLERDGRVFGRIEEILVLDMFIEQGITGVDRLGVDGDVHRAGLRGLVVHDRAAGLVEAVHLVGVAEVVVLEARLGVRGVDGVGLRRSQGAAGDGSEGEDKGEFLHGESPG